MNNSFQDVTPCSLAGSYQHLCRTFCLHLQAAGFYNMLVPFCLATWYHIPVIDNFYVRVEVVTAAQPKIHIFMDIMPCLPVNMA
jgi:hypothetical protein